MTRLESLNIAIRDCKHYSDEVKKIENYMSIDCPYKYSLNFRLLAANYGELEDKEEKQVVEEFIEDYAKMLVKITKDILAADIEKEIKTCDYIWVDTTKYLAIFMVKWILFPDSDIEEDERFQKDLTEKQSFYEPYIPFYKKLIECMAENDDKNSTQYKRFLMDTDLNIGGKKFIF